MFLISHRGNLTGPNSCEENSPEAIDRAIEIGYHVEVDLRYIDNKFMLGHDEGQYEVDLDWLTERRDFLWIHCKNLEALSKMCFSKFMYFWHQTDNYTITSHGFVWAYPGKQPVDGCCIMVLPELEWPLEECVKLKTMGICSDYVETLRSM
jgi:hypothetical protein